MFIQRNQYHEALYHVLDDNIPEPDLPPYFRGEFFLTIRRINSTPLSLAKINVKQIYRFLIEEITMTPYNQWDRAWRLSRQYKLGPNITSFLFKLLHQILPTAERVARIPNQSPNSTKCRAGVPESLLHAMFDCPENQGGR